MNGILNSTIHHLPSIRKTIVVDVVFEGFVRCREVQKKTKETTCRRCRNGPLKKASLKRLSAQDKLHRSKPMRVSQRPSAMKLSSRTWTAKNCRGKRGRTRSRITPDILTNFCSCRNSTRLNTVKMRNQAQAGTPTRRLLD